jgi:hypothetical protein
MRSFSRNTSPEVHWHLAPMVKSEREYQMIDEALRRCNAVITAKKITG